MNTAPRSAWPPDFPDVVIHCDLAERDRHPDYHAAKAGDADAAKRLAEGLISVEALRALAQLAIGDAALAPVTALEDLGFNAIPDAMAQVIGQRIGAEVAAGQMVQANRVGHTRATGWRRLVTPATFCGEVERGRRYVLVDDHVGLGGTLANLRGFIELNGGSVVAMTCLTESRQARVIAVRPETLRVLRLRHGQPLETFWLDIFGHRLDRLTEVEAAYLARQPSLEHIRDRMAETAEQARRGGLSALPPGR